MPVAPKVTTQKSNIRIGTRFLLVTGGAAGNFTVAGIRTQDILESVQFISATFVCTDLTAQFTISAANTINNTGGTASTGGCLLVIWTPVDVKSDTT